MAVSGPHETNRDHYRSDHVAPARNPPSQRDRPAPACFRLGQVGASDLLLCRMRRSARPELLADQGHLEIVHGGPRAAA